MNFPVLVKHESDPAAFITLWAQRYSYSAGEEDYDSNVRHDDSDYAQDDLVALMRYLTNKRGAGANE